MVNGLDFSVADDGTGPRTLSKRELVGLFDAGYEAKFPSKEVEQLRAKLAEAELKLLSIPTAGLVWEEQVERPELELRTHFPVLKAKPALDVEGAQPSDIPHILIEGDNLHALTILQATHKGKVDVIYIDPPYNTGEDFIYNDKFIGEEHEWRHSAWLSFMDKRLRLARELLTPQGVVFISIDDNEQAHLKLLCDQVFGQNCMLGNLTWVNKTQPTNSGSARFKIQQNIEYVLVYGNTSKTVFPGFQLSQTITRNYPNEGKLGKCRLVGIEDSDRGRKSRETMKFPILGTTPEAGKRWKIGKETAERLIEEERLELVNGKVYKVVYPQDEDPGFVPFWSHLATDSTGTAQSGKATLGRLIGKDHGFDTVKPLGLVSEILTHLPRSASVLDFFAGSGTTAQAVAALNEQDGGTRQAILVTNNENDICRKVTQPRIKAVLTGQWADGKPHDALPGSLVYYQVDLLVRRSSRAA